MKSKSVRVHASPDHGGIAPEMYHRQFQSKLLDIEKGRYEVAPIKPGKDIPTGCRVLSLDIMRFPEDEEDMCEGSSDGRSSSAGSTPEPRSYSGSPRTAAAREQITLMSASKLTLSTLCPEPVRRLMFPNSASRRASTSSRASSSTSASNTSMRSM